jgi:small subunit ribosomal protein S16
MLMMRLQRVGRKNDPSYRIVVTDKRTGPKSNKHVAIIGSYNPKMSHIQLDAEAAKDWLSKGVQPSDTVHNILVKQKVINAKTINPLPRKSPIVDEEALAKEKEEKEEKEAAAKEEAEAKEAESTDETPAETEESTEAPADEETKEEAPAAEVTEESAPEAETEEAPAEETEEKKEA